ncbi:MAG: peroxidase family protein, partial [Planctomycetota bacterium]
LVLLDIGPRTGVPFTLDTTLEISGLNLGGPGLRLEVVGVGSFPCVATTRTAADCPMAARSIPPGRYDVFLRDAGGSSRLRAGLLVVNPQPVLQSCTPDDFDPNFNRTLRITGTGFVGAVRVRFLDGGGVMMGGPMAATVSGGTRIVTESPVLPGLAGPLSATVQITNGDGQEAVAGIAVSVDARVGDTRTIDGTGNNLGQASLGGADIHLRRAVAPDYADGISTPAGAGRPGARAVSSAVADQPAPVPNAQGASDFLWQWGQFLDHDIDLTPAASPPQPLDIPVPRGDPIVDTGSAGGVVLGFDRSVHDPSTGTGPGNPRQQLNRITSWIDASNVYGSDDARASELRTRDGTGRLRTSAGNLLPLNVRGFDNAPTAADPGLFLAGDVRANEQVGLTALHTLFVREHNRVADDLRARNPHLSGDEVYEAARRRVGAEMQVITDREFLPLLLGPGALSPYAGYDASVVASVSNVFSTACYRLGHSTVSGRLLRLDAFFTPRRIPDEGGIDPVLRGLAAQRAEEIDLFVVDDLRNFLFGPPGAGGLDLAALNIQRGRDHGLPGYNDCRERLGLPRRSSFAEVSSDPAVQARLAAAYAGVDEIDAWVGGLAEDHLPGAMVGELVFTVLRDQFERLRDGDRFWYRNVFSGDALAELEATTLADVIRRNTAIAGEIADDVFRVP